MKRILYSIMVLATFYLASCNSNKKEQVRMYIPTDSILKLFENQMTEYCKDLNINKLSYAVVSDNKIVDSKYIGEQQIGTGNNITYPIGNITDIMASVLILRQIEAGKANLKDKLVEHGVNGPEINKATIKQLLSYTYLDKPGSTFTYDNLRPMILKNVLESITGESFSDQIEKEIFDECDMDHSLITENATVQSSVSDLALFSIALDNKEIFDDTATTDLMYRPIYLSDGEQAPSAIGWFVQFYNDKKFVWSFGVGDNYSSLIIKSLADKLTLIVLANSSNLNKPFRLEEGNIFKSPVSISFLKKFVFRNDTFPDFKATQHDSLINSAFENIRKSKHKKLLINELIANINMFHFMDKGVEKDKFLDLYNKYLPNDVPWNLLEKKPRAIIDNVVDYVKMYRKFHLDHDTLVNVYAVGEFVKELVFDPWQYDNIELFLDIHNNKKNTFDNKVHRHYRFTYDYPEMTGNYSTAENIVFAQSDPSKTTYIMEIKIPWTTLDSIRPTDGAKLGFDISVGDNDGTMRETCINWRFEKQQRPWENPSLYGTLLLNKVPIENFNDSVCTSSKCTKPIQIDGKVELEWEKSIKYCFTKTTSGAMPDKKDISGTFKTMWDNQNLYFLVEITDDVKKLLPTSADYGWIENYNHDTIWAMTPVNSKYAGGALTNRFVNTTLVLKKGDYTLHYSSNQTNSSARWTAKQPDMNFYGIVVY